MNNLDQGVTDESFGLTASPGFTEWLAATGGSLAFSTYQAGKLFLIGTGANGRISVFERTFPRSMGIAVSDDGRSFALATQYQIQRFDNVMPPGQRTDDGYDALYAPHAAWVTGDVLAHDVGWRADGRPLFVNTLFGCIAAVSDGFSFRPVWSPPFVSALAAEDRCHLNGMAMRDGNPRYATVVARSDVAEGWRNERRGGGGVIDVATGEFVASGLSMPHSPRLHQGRLWVLNSGAGAFGHVDLAAGRFEPIALCPGYARGLAFVDGHAVIGLSLPRDENFAGLPLDDVLRERGVEPWCGLAVIDLATGELAHWLRIEGIVRELYDVACLPGVRRPMAIGFKTEDVHRVISIEPEVPGSGV